MKKTILSLLCAICALAANAQTYGSKPYQDRPPFGEGKFYLASSLSGLDLRFNDLEKWNMDVTAKGGYMFQDNWMITAQAAYNWRQKTHNAFTAGAGLRYYIAQNGLWVGASGNYVHKYHTYDDFMPSVQLGYSFFLNRTVTLEPEIFYNQSLKDNDYSGLGFRIGIGIYFE